MKTVRFTVGSRLPRPCRSAGVASAQTTRRRCVDPKLEVRTVATGLAQPVQMEFIGDRRLLRAGEADRQVKRVKDGVRPTVVLDLTVNSNSERGLLGIALDKYFKLNGYVYLYWSESTTGRRQHGAATRAAARQPARPLPLGRHVALLRQDPAPLAGAPGRRDQPDEPGRTRCSAATTTAAWCASGPDGKIYLIRSATPAVAGSCRTWSTGRSSPAARRRHRRRPVRRPGPGRRPPHGRDPAPEPGRHGAARQPVLPARRRARRPGRRVTSRRSTRTAAQRLRHGVRPVQRRPVGAGERRRLLQRDQPHRARLQLRLGAGHGPARARRAVQGDRDDADARSRPTRPRRPATTGSSRSAGTRSTSPTRPGRRTTACSSSRARSSVTRSSRGSTRSPRAASTSLSGKELGKDYKGDLFVGSRPRHLRGGNLFRLPIANNRKKVDARRPAPARPRRRQRGQVRDHRERVAALRRELRRHAGHQGEPGRHALRRLLLAGHGLRDPQASRTRARGRGVRLRPRVGFWG